MKPCENVYSQQVLNGPTSIIDVEADFDLFVISRRKIIKIDIEGMLNLFYLFVLLGNSHEMIRTD